MGNQRIQINRVGVIPKGQWGKWRLITNLLYPRGHSINDVINPDLCALTYTAVEKLAQRAMSRGKGVLMTKLDIHVQCRVSLLLGPSQWPRSAPPWAILGRFNLPRQNVALWTVVRPQDI